MTAQRQSRVTCRQRGGSTLEYVAILALLAIALVFGGGLNIGKGVKSIFHKLTGTFDSVQSDTGGAPEHKR